MLSSATKFADDAAGLEKSLRLVQGLCTFVAGLSLSLEDAAPWRQARSQLALGRRYFRLLKWHSCWNTAYAILNGDEQDAIAKLLAVCNSSVLGLYYFLEMPTITNAMGVTHSSFGARLQHEADRCWFYGIAFSILLSLYRLLRIFLERWTSLGAANTTKTNQDEKPKEGPTEDPPDDLIYMALLTRLVIDCCDLTIPGSTLGWIPVQLSVVGGAQFTSSALAGMQIWQRVQAED